MSTRTLMMVVAASAALCVSSSAFAQYQGVAANDKGNYGAVAYSSTKAGAESAARRTCYEAFGEGCKAISNPSSWAFVIIKCTDDGSHVHMASSPNGWGAAERSARAIARSFGRTDCSVLDTR